MKATALQRLFLHYNVSMKKETTKTAHVKELMKLAVVTDHTTCQNREKIKESRAAMDSKTNKKQPAQGTKADAEEGARTSAA